MRRHGPVRERDQPGRAQADPLAGRGDPVGAADEGAGPQVERALVLQQLAVADVERLVVDEQAQQLAVRDVDDGLAVLGVAVAGLGVGQGTALVEGVEVGAGDGVRLALVEVAAHADVAVGQREHRLGLGEQVEPELRLAHAPRVDGERAGGDHGSSSSRSCTTTSAPDAAAPRPDRPGRRRRRSRSRPRGRPARPPGRPRRPPPAPRARRGRRRRRGRCRAPACPAATARGR